MPRKTAQKFSLVLPAVLLILIGLNLVIFRITKNYLPCANTFSCTESLKVSVRNNEDAIFDGQNITPPKIDLSQVEAEPNVLGDATASGEKHIYVDLTNQTLKAYEGDSLFLEARTASGKWFPTPIGEFTIWSKVRATLMSGGEGADYYYLPNVQYVMFFYNSEIAQSRGFAIHGSYWHNNFGHAMSHGCINLRNIDAQKLYYWTDPPTAQNGSATAKQGEGTKITIYGKAP